MFLNRIFNITVNVLLVACVQVIGSFLKSTYSAHFKVSPAFRSNLFAQRGAKRISTSIRFMEPGFVLAILNLKTGLIKYLYSSLHKSKSIIQWQ